jgi:hypothetical protein
VHHLSLGSPPLVSPIIPRRLESSLAREADLKREVEELKGAVEVKNRELGAAHDL